MLLDLPLKFKSQREIIYRLEFVHHLALSLGLSTRCIHFCLAVVANLLLEALSNMS